MKIGWTVNVARSLTLTPIQGIVSAVTANNVSIVLLNDTRHIDLIEHEFLASELQVTSEVWPVTGPDFNQWNTKADLFFYLLSKINGDDWFRRSEFKYVGIYADLRANCFTLKDRDGKVTEPVDLLNAFKEK